MRDESDAFIPPGRLRTMQIINSALVAGVVFLLGIALYLVLVQNQGRPLGQAQGPPIQSVLALGLLAVLAVVSRVVPDAMIRQGVRRIARGELPSPPGTAPAPTGDADQLLGLRQTSSIIRLAMLEGPAVFCCIAFLTEGRIYVLGGVLLAVLLMLTRFPTEGGLRAWLLVQLDMLDRERRQINPDGAP